MTPSTYYFNEGCCDIHLMMKKVTLTVFRKFKTLYMIIFNILLTLNNTIFIKIVILRMVTY